jgi:Holliday junction resolvase-like predicted endonuclease
MTDDELKELVASLVVGNKELREAQREAQRETSAQIKLTSEQMKLTDERMQRTVEQMKRTYEQLKRTDEKLERIGIQVGNISNNQGNVAEEFFFNSLANDTHLGLIHFEDITMNMTKHRGQIQEEYDLVMTNGDAVGIIEVKYKAHENDLDKLERKMRHFKKLFPIYNTYKLYGAIASFHINDDAKRQALERGFFVLQRSGEVVHTDCAENLLVL